MKNPSTEEPLTEDLLSELLELPALSQLDEQYTSFERTLAGYLEELLLEKNFVRSDVVRRAGLNETFGYQIFMGQRGASRNKIIQLAFAMGLTLKESNRLLQLAGCSSLYCKNRRDAIIVFCLDRGYSLQKADDELYAFKEDTIT